ncbi:MAG TPA: hypothetical protein VJ508_13945, partial [Saprospiraceae bacterium]|nr:hypothetical protein [Saprospiraceae bacterium]
ILSILNIPVLVGGLVKVLKVFPSPIENEMPGVGFGVNSESPALRGVIVCIFIVTESLVV